MTRQNCPVIMHWTNVCAALTFWPRHTRIICAARDPWRHLYDPNDNCMIPVAYMSSTTSLSWDTICSVCWCWWWMLCWELQLIFQFCSCN